MKFYKPLSLITHPSSLNSDLSLRDKSEFNATAALPKGRAAVLLYAFICDLKYNGNC